MTAEIVTTPTAERLMRAAESCSERLIVASPFVTGALCDVMDRVPVSASRTLITRLDVVGFAQGASDLSVVRRLGDGGVSVRALRDLHAKVYVFDSACALVTSANATFSGLYRNRECGVALSDPDAVNTAASLVLTGLGAAERPQPWTPTELAELEGPVRALHDRLVSWHPLLLDGAETEARAVVRHGAVAELAGELSGWTQLVLAAICKLPEKFSLDALEDACRSEAKRLYPQNRHVRPQIRKQLQRLRDMGIVAFLGDGQYARLLVDEAL